MTGQGSAPAPEIKDHKLTWARWKPSPNQGGQLLRPDILVVHYTGGVTLEGAVTTLCDPRQWEPGTGGALVKRKRRSSQLVIGRGGEAVQLVAFNRVAWHAGESIWRGRDQVNLFSIGIELDNPGPLERDTQGRWHPVQRSKPFYDPEQVLLARHKAGGPLRGWLKYTRAQLAALERAALAIVRAYPLITEVVGHEDVSPGRKTDPGPAFPMVELRNKLFTPAA